MADPASLKSVEYDRQNQLEGLLRRHDYVLEPECFATITQYIKAGGKAGNIIDLLQDNYHGFPHMANLVTEWLNKFLAPDHEGAGPGLTGHPALAATSAAGGGGAAGAGEPLDEFLFLKEWVVAHCNPGSLTTQNRQARDWVNKLIAHPRGRALLLSLSAQHHSSLLLTFAVKRILDKGYVEEVAKVGSSLAFHFNVFHHLLSLRLAAAAQAIRPAGADAGAAAGALLGLCQEMGETSAASEVTYMFAAQLLQLLGSHPRAGPVFQRLGQELQAAATAAAPTAWQFMRLLLPPEDGLCSPTLRQAASLVVKLLASFQPPAGGTRTGLQGRPVFAACLPLVQQPAPVVQLHAADVLALAKFVRDAGDAAHARLAPVLQHPALLQLLISGVFVPGKAVSVDVREAAIDILAAMTSLPSAAHQPPLPAALAAALGSPAPGGHTGGQTGGPPGGLQPWQRAQCMDESKAALRMVLAVGAKAGARLAPEDVAAVHQVVAVPVAGAALLHFMRCQLCQPDYYAESVVAASAAPAFIRMSLLVARTQPGLCPQVVWLLGGALAAQGSGRAEVTALTTGVLVQLLREGRAAAAVQGALQQWAGRADPSLVRGMAMQVLGCCAPPYSAAFARWLLNLMVSSNMKLHSVRDGRGGPAAGAGPAAPGSTATGGAMSSAALLQEFAAEVLALAGGGVSSGGPLVLSKEEAALLQALAKGR